MKVEFLESGSADCPLIRIYGDEPEICQQFHQALERLANGRAQEVALTDLAGVEPLGGCRLIAQVDKRDRGIVCTGGNDFSWRLTPPTWENVAGLIEPFCRAGANGHQWIEQAPTSEVRVVMSASKEGCW
jgi:hypothetical protein